MSKLRSLVHVLSGCVALSFFLFCHEAHAQNANVLHSVLFAPGARCGFLGECSQFDEIGMHIGTGIAVRTDSSRSYWDAHGALRLSLTALDLFEGGAAFAGHLSSDGDTAMRFTTSPVSLYARLRLLPLPLGRLALAPLRLALAYQHDLVLEPFGQNEPPGMSRGTLRVIAGRSWGRLDVDGSLGLVLARPDDARPRLLAYDLGATASVWLWRAVERAPGEELRLTAEALTRISLHPAFPSEQNLLVGVLGKTASGYGGGVAFGTQVVDQRAGFLAMARLQISWGKRHKNPWAERKAAEPWTTPDFIWKLLGAIDPVVGADGCIYTDPTPERPSTKWFCIGQPAADDPSQIVLKNGQRIAAGTHLWETGGSLRLNDGSRVIDIPLSARARKAVWDYIDDRKREIAKNQVEGWQAVCDGKVSILHGHENNPGGAMMAAGNDDGHAQYALAGAELLRSMYCDPKASTEDQALAALGSLGALRTAHGPMWARPKQLRGFSEAGDGEASAGKGGGGAPAGDSAKNLPKTGSASVAAPVIKLRSRINESQYAVRLAEGMSEQAQRDVDNLLLQLSNGNVNPGIGRRGLGGNFFELRGRNAGRVIIKATGDDSFDIVGKFQGHVRGDAENSRLINRLMEDYQNLSK